MTDGKMDPLTSGAIWQSCHEGAQSEVSTHQQHWDGQSVCRVASLHMSEPLPNSKVGMVAIVAWIFLRSAGRRAVRVRPSGPLRLWPRVSWMVVTAIGPMHMSAHPHTAPNTHLSKIHTSSPRARGSGRGSGIVSGGSSAQHASRSGGSRTALEPRSPAPFLGTSFRPEQAPPRGVGRSPRQSPLLAEQVPGRRPRSAAPPSGRQSSSRRESPLLTRARAEPPLEALPRRPPSRAEPSLAAPVVSPSSFSGVSHRCSREHVQGQPPTHAPTAPRGAMSVRRTSSQPRMRRASP